MTKALWILFAFVTGTVLVRSLAVAEFNWDVAWLLYVAEQVIDGSALYVDIFEENPPLIIWFSMGPVMLSRWTGLPSIVLYDVAVLVIALISCGLTSRIIARSWPEWPADRGAAVIGLLLCLMTIAPGIDYGQRENLLLIVLTPYLFAAASRLDGRPLPTTEAILIGAFSAGGLALKPFFALAWLAVEGTIFVADRTRWRCPENFVIAGILGGFYLWLLAFNPAYRAVLELIVQLSASYQGSGTEALRLPAIYLACGTILIFAAVRPSKPGGSLRRIAMAAAMAFLTIAVIQGADFSYRYLPAEALMYLVLGLSALGLMAGPEQLREVFRFAPRQTASAVMLALCIWSGGTLAFEAKQTFAASPTQRTVIDGLSQVVKQHASGQPIWLMSTSVSPAFPVVNLGGAKWASRYCCVSFIASVYTEQERRTVPFPYHDMRKLSPLEQRQFDEVVEDLQRTPPMLIIIDTNSNKQAIGPSAFRFLEYFKRDKRFSRIFSRYELLTAIEPYRVYKRRS